MCKKLASSLLIFLIVFVTSAQNNYQHYTSSDGLQHDVTYNMIQDSKGYIWIGTDDGLSKFDGKDFKNYSLKDGLTSNYVMDVKELPDGNFAIATWGGGLHFLENDTIHKAPSFKDTNVKSYEITFFDNKLYTDSGVEIAIYDLKTKRFQSKVYVKNEQNFVDDLELDVEYHKLKPFIINNKVYVHNQELSNDNFKGVKELSSSFKLQSVFPFLSEFEISSALEIEIDSYVFATKTTLLFSNRNNIHKKITIHGIKENEFVVKILKAPHEKNIFLLVVKNEKGEKRLIQFNIETKKTMDFSQIIGFNTTISDAIFDFENNLWISTFGDGIYCFYYSNPTIKTVLEGAYIIDILKIDSTVYAQTSSKLYVFTKDSLTDNLTTDGFAKHLSNINNKVTVSSLRAKPSKTPKFNLVSGRFYSKTKGGFIRQGDTLFINQKQVLISNELFVNLVEEKEHSIHLYTNKGRWMYDLKNETFTRDSLFQIGLPSEKINDAIIKDNTYYIATDKGLVIKNKDSISLYNNKTGLKNERINCILLKENTIYLGTQSGLSVIKDSKVYHFSKSFGIQSLAIHKIIELNNHLWLAGNNGISIVNLKDVKATNPPKIHISQNNKNFVYEVITYQDRNAINVEYQLNKNQWLSLNPNENSLDFTNFAPNKYQIQFRVQNSHSDWMYSSIFNFEIKPPWYKVWWILLLLFLCFSSFIGVVFLSRLKAVSKRNEILKNEISKRILAESELTEARDTIARDFHDDLGNKLASISLLSEVLSTKVKKENSNMIMTIKNDADYLYKGTKDFIFSLQEKSNYLDELNIYLTDFAEDYLYQFGVDLEVESTIKSNIKLPYYWSKQIIFIFKEAITNIVKHANSNSVKFIFNCNDTHLEIKLSDDGKGFKEGAIQSNGLKNMKSRAKKIDCELNITSIPNQGTTITFLGQLP
ncbi:hypothetical protein IU405_05225 [Polaribacter sp. BAL334]|uniref:sensor histidine kinase n=1 Tax=Polaribacter sp. BAL334 TaxID=1708178 RepID=UPI0018D2360E|nr:two-component regulator propeller domain-containing protein [Polaribacter sp. BAL334]MBG7611647.1 hypothetical protein [Polaribacter sp. BAL334]